MRKLLLMATLVVAACGSASSATTTTVAATTATVAAPATTGAPATTATTTDPSTTGPSTTVAAAFPVVVAGAEITARPERIISLSPTSTEVLFAIGAGDQVVAVDSLSNYPAEAPVTDLSAFEPSVEAIAAYEPDLVIVSWDPGDLVAGLDALGIPVISHFDPFGIDDAYSQIEQLGTATGNAASATELIVRMQADIAALVEEHRIPGTTFSYYHEVDNTLYSATSQTFIGSIYGLFGLENIADPADPDGFGFPQLSAEYILDSDPDLIFYGCAVWCGTNPDTIAERPGWSGLTAVERGALTQLDDDVVSRWGPRLVEFVRVIGESLQAAVGASA